MQNSELTHVDHVLDRPPIDIEKTERTKITAGDEHEKQEDGLNDTTTDLYDRFSPRRKHVITIVLSFCGFLSSTSSTVVLSAVPEVAATFRTTDDIIAINNAVYLLCMGLSPIICGPLSRLHGRRWLIVASTFMFTAWSIGSALAPSLGLFFFFRICTAFVGAVFLIVPTATLGDIYRPTQRGKALGWFLSGTLVGPAFGPFIGGVIVTFTSWRVIYWMQTGLGAVAVVATFFLLPETIHEKGSKQLEGLPPLKKAVRIGHMMNPWGVLKPFKNPSIVIAALGSSSLIWNQYSLLTPIRLILDPRFSLTSPIQAGLFFLAPGTGYFVGTFFGGKYADHVVKKYIAKTGRRVPEDRLRSVLPFLGIMIPSCMIIYGWSIERKAGGIALPVIVMFIQGVATQCSYPSINAYCLDVFPDRAAEVVSGNYVARFLFAAAGSAAALPIVDAIGVGWFSTISACFMLSTATAIALLIQFGQRWKRTKASSSGLAVAATTPQV